MTDQGRFPFLRKLVELEEKEENDQIRDEFEHLTPLERERKGRALLGLTLAERHFSPAEHVLATFVLSGRKKLPLFSLETGDAVRLFSRRSDADDIPSATVYEKNADSITVALHGAWPEWLEEGDAVELHHAANRVTYRRMKEALDAVEETQKTRLAVFRDISLGEKKPSINPEPAKLAWFDKHLNASQKESVMKAMASRDVFLVHGPPGTGKTTALIEIIRQAVARKETVFVTAPSNTACDNLLERLVAQKIPALRLGHPARISPALRDHTLDFKLALHPLGRQISVSQMELDRLYKRWDRYRGRRSPGRDAERELKSDISFHKQEIQTLKKDVFKTVMKEARVIVGTPAGVQDRAVRDREFDLVVFDEATQATEPISWIPLLRAGRVVMAGDHFQLPPTVRSTEAEKQGLGVSLFERFYSVLKEDSKTLLERQYRMHDKIMGFSSKMFYKNLLVADESVRTHTLADLKGVDRVPETEEALLFIDTAGKGFEEKLEEGSESRYNPEEAELVLSQLRKMLSLGVPPSEIAVIAPYSAQVRLLTSLTPDPAVEMDSVDGFQGREKELVIVSLVRSNLTGEMGFLNDTRRMNVAMTRARRKLVVIGDSATLSSLDFYKKFIEYAEAAGGYKTAWEISE